MERSQKIDKASTKEVVAGRASITLSALSVFTLVLTVVDWLGRWQTLVQLRQYVPYLLTAPALVVEMIMVCILLTYTTRLERQRIEDSKPLVILPYGLQHVQRKRISWRLICLLGALGAIVFAVAVSLWLHHRPLPRPPEKAFTPKPAIIQGTTAPIMPAQDLREKQKFEKKVLPHNVPKIGSQTSLQLNPPQPQISAGISAQPSIPSDTSTPYPQGVPQQTALDSIHRKTAFGGTPYNAVVMVEQGLWKVQSDWEASLTSIDAEAGRGSQSPNSDDIVERFREADEATNAKYAGMTNFIDDARRSALGLLQLTPNQDLKDQAEFAAADQAARIRPKIADFKSRHLNAARYSKMLSYLENLRSRVGDRPQP